MKAIFFILLLILAPTNAVAAQESATNQVVQIEVSSTNGKIQWSKIADAVTRELGLKVPFIDQMSSQELDLKATSTRWLLFGVNQALQPAIRISIDRSALAVVVKIDPAELKHRTRKISNSFRASLNWIKGQQESGLRPFFESATETDTSELESAKHIVVLVHGFNSSNDRMNTLAQRIKKSGTRKDPRTVARFDYVTSDGVQTAADLLDQELRQLVAKNPDCQISLVTHSMGGLVSRAVIEREAFDVTQVKRIIMIAPPNHGTNLADLPPNTDQFITLLSQFDVNGIRQALQDLAAEANLAIEDLQPSSEILGELNDLERNPNIHYSILLGNQGLLTVAQNKKLNQLARRMQKADQQLIVQGGRELAALMTLLAGEIVSPKGDGVVSVDSGKLDQVDDTLVMKFRHSDLLRDDASSQARVIRQIVKRLDKTVAEDE